VSERCFEVWRGSDPGGRLPYFLRLPVSRTETVLLAASGPWPGAKDMFCLRIDDLPPDASLLESHEVEACRWRGRSIELVLRRSQRRRSLFVWLRRRDGREQVFWRTERTMRGARPGARVPAAQGLDRPLQISVDDRERQAWRFREQRAVLEVRRLPVGDYGIVHGDRLVAAVERKRIDGLATQAVDGSLSLALVELAALPRAALVVEGRLSDLMKVNHVDTGWLLSLIVSLQVAHPGVGWAFAENRTLAQDFAFRWLAAARQSVTNRTAGDAGRAGDEAGARQATGAADTVATGLPVQGEARRLRPGVAIGDPTARKREAMRIAESGAIWTSRAYAQHFGISAGTAWSDLSALVEQGSLEAEGEKRGRRYVYRREK